MRKGLKFNIAIILTLILLCCNFGGNRQLVSRDSVDVLTATSTINPAIQLAEPDPEPESEPEPDPEPEPEIRLVMIGDMLLHMQVEASGRKEDESYEFNHLFDMVREDIQAADVSIVNEEVLLGGKDLGISGYPCFNGPYEVADAIENAGFNVVLHATNHSFDRGKKGLINCLNNWKENHPDINIIGMYDSQEASNEIYVYEKDGMKVAILNYTYGTNGIDPPSGMSWSVNMLYRNEVIEDIKRAHELADFVVVCPHWGTEYQLKEDSYQREWAQLFLENGVDLVIGTHPHVIEPIEVMSDGEHQMVVYYSLGNFVNWTETEGRGIANRVIGGMADVTIGRDDSGRVVIKDYGIVPLVTHLIYGYGNVKTYKLEDYSQELAEQNEVVKKDGVFDYDYVVDTCRSVWGEYFDKYMDSLPKELP